MTAGPSWLRDERGLTLTELVVVGVLATIVMLALTAFYTNSQQVWIDGSTQALAQRDATLLVDEMGRWIRPAAQAVVSPTGDQLTLGYAGGTTVDFHVAPDHHLHLFVDNGDRGAIVDTPVTRFRVATNDTIVRLDLAELRTAYGDSVRISSAFGLLGN